MAEKHPYMSGSGGLVQAVNHPTAARWFAGRQVPGAIRENPEAGARNIFSGFFINRWRLVRYAAYARPIRYRSG